MLRSRASLAALAAFVCASCGHADRTPVGRPEAPAQAAATGPADAPDAHGLVRDGAPVLGHVLVPSGAQLLADVRRHLAPAALAGKLTPHELLGGLVARAGVDPRVAQNLDLQRPLGCVVGQPEALPGEFACVFGYTGGATALVRDVGAFAVADGHAGALGRQQGALYFDALGGDVVVSGSHDYFARTRTYLAHNLVERAAETTADIEAVLFTRDLHARYGAAIEAWVTAPDAREQAFMQELKARVPAPAWRALEVLDAAKTELDRLNVRELGEHEQAVVSLDLGDHGAALRWQVVPTRGGRFPAASLSRGRRLDPDFIEALPAGTLLLIGQNIDRRAAVAWSQYSTGGTTEEEVQLRLRAYATSRSELRGAPVSPEVVAREVAEDRDLYQGHAAHALLEQPGSLLGLGLLSVHRLAPGAAARDAWLAWARRFAADAVLSPALRDYISWSFTPAAYDVDGVPVDRWTLRPGRRLLGKRELDELAAVSPTLAAEGLHIDRLEVHGNVYFAVAPGAEEPLLRRALAAREGRHSLHDDANLRRVLDRAAGANVFMAFDIARSLDWSERLLVHFGAIEAGTLPRTLGRGLDDVQIHFAEPDSGLAGGEIVVGPGVLAALKRWSP